MSDRRWIESLEDRRFLSAGPAGAIAAEPASALIVPHPAAININKILGTYSGTVTLTTPAGLKPYKFTVVISSINVTTKLVQGTISLPKLHFSNIALSSKSTYTAATKQFIIRIVSTGSPAPQTLSITLKGNITAQNLAAKILTGRFSGFVPFNGQARVPVDGSFSVTKS